jgi:polyhydroxyalkanoate synthesis regulator phasin
MAERRGTGRSKGSGGARRASTGASRSTGGRSSSSGASRSGAAARSSSARKAAARKGGQARGRQQRARAGARRAATTATKPAERLDISAKSVAEFREILRKNLIRPLDLVMLTRDRIEEAMNDAAERGRMTADDAQELAASLIQRGRKQTNDVLKDLEQLLGRGRDEIEGRTTGARRTGTDAARRARRQVEGAAGRARSRAVRAADPALAQADRVRRAAGVGPTFPVMGYDELTAAQVQSRLPDLTPAQLRKVRDYERRHANRKTVLNTIEERLR